MAEPLVFYINKDDDYAYADPLLDDCILAIEKKAYDAVVSSLKICARYHFGDGTVDRKDVMEALSVLNHIGEHENTYSSRSKNE